MGVVVNKNVETDRLYIHEVLAINKEGQQSLFKTGGPCKEQASIPAAKLHLLSWYITKYTE